MGRILEVAPLQGYAPEIAPWLWAMEETRRRTRSHASGLDQGVVDWAGPGGAENGIGTLLYHIAIVEMFWLHSQILDRWDLFPAEDFPIEPFTDGRITPVTGISAAEHLARLDRSRALFLKRMKDVSAEDWSRLRDPVGEDDAASPAWVVFHLIEHEAGHTAQIAVMEKRARAALG